jgi:uncharacterized RDD family membrane protein YckC
MQDSGMAIPRSAVAMDIAGVGPRFVALLIDGVILGVIGSVIGAIFGDRPGEVGVGSGISVIIQAAYMIILLSQWGTTLGGRVLGLKVVDSGGNMPSVGTAAIRWLMSIVSGAVILIGYLWAFWDSNKQTWHDKVAGTFVVKA